MSRFRTFIIRFGAPLVVLVGVGGAFAARRAVTLKHNMEAWADSLKHGSGPVTLELPFVPAYLEGRKIGALRSVRLERHQPRTVDSLRLVIDLSRGSANDVGLRGCTFELATFDPGDLKRALECAPDTAGLVRFGKVAFEQGGEATLYVSAAELPCAPWTDHQDRGECISARVRRQVDREMLRVREEMRQHLPGR